jgi:hypothetical protein
MLLTDRSDEPHANPLDEVERIAASNEWLFDRPREHEITMVVRGSLTDHQVSVTWMHDLEALHLACAFELKVPTRRRAEAQQLVLLINEQMWIGHFDLWGEIGLVMYRHALVLTGGLRASGGQCEALLSNGLGACEQFFPAFQFVVWAGKSAREVLDAALLETAGEA